MPDTLKDRRYPHLRLVEPSRNPFRPAGRCIGCQGVINVSRSGSMLDYVCNRLINPRPNPGQPAQAARTPRSGSYETRLDRMQALHLELRQGRPGWGRLDIRALERMVD